MARETIEKFYSDLSGEEIEETFPTVSFVIDGVGYEVDLTPAQREAFEKAIAPYIAAGRRSATRTKRTQPARNSGPNAKTVRAWAVENGHEVPPRGRVPKAIIEAYEAAH